MGYVISFAGFPLIWKSQLISEICLSTLHAECVALSSAIRALLPIRSMTTEILTFLKLPSFNPTEVHCCLCEDNQGAHLLAANQRVTSRTKYFNVKWHHFWSHVQNSFNHDDPNRFLVVLKIDTENQQADCLTKGSVRVKFEHSRKLVQGW